MALASCRISAPGKLMILGEHAVLHGRHAIVAAVDQRLHVELTPRADATITVTSELGSHQTTLTELADETHCRFVIAAIRECRDWLSDGFDLTIRSEFTSTVGLGSSAAVTAATLGACQVASGQELEPEGLFDAGLRAILTVQGSGSGADLAASLLGGVLLYRTKPRTLKPIATDLPLTVVSSGYKTSTTDVIANVRSRRQRHPEIFDALYAAMDASAVAAAEAITQQAWRRLGEIFDVNASLMEAIGVSSTDLANRLQRLRETVGIHGAKLSGAGLGDCLIGIGQGTPPAEAGEQLNLRVTPHGLRSES